MSYSFCQMKALRTLGILHRQFLMAKRGPLMTLQLICQFSLNQRLLPESLSPKIPGQDHSEAD